MNDKSATRGSRGGLARYLAYRNHFKFHQKINAATAATNHFENDSEKS